MSTATLEYESTAVADETLQYRALHTGAILALVVGIVSVFTVISATNSLEGALMTAPIPVLGMFLGIRSWARIRCEPERYTGAPLALSGFVLSLAFLLGGVGYSSYVYATEVPDGYERISFAAMMPSEIEERNGVVVPPEIAALDGKKVFIKGYIRPDSVKVSRGIDQFLLVRDNNQCCFGDLSSVKYYDQILVNMAGKRRVDYSNGVFRMGGILKVEPQNLKRNPLNPAPVFTLTADYAK